MTKLARYAVLAAVLLLALALPAAAVIIDLNPSDANSITDQESIVSFLFVEENYNETFLVPYPSHDGQAIVNSGNYPGQTSRFFDTVVVGDYINLVFYVFNGGPYRWSDYHFEFWTPDFSQRVTPDLRDYGNLIFKNSNYANGIVEFWSPDWQEVGVTNTFYLRFETSLLTNPLGIRQVATTVPVPPAVWLLGSGLLGLAGWRYRHRKL